MDTFRPIDGILTDAADATKSPGMMKSLQVLIEELEQDRSLDEPDRLRERVEVLDRIEACFPERADSGNDGLQRRVMALRARLEAINHALYQDLRGAIRRGGGRARLTPWLPASDGDGGAIGGEGYDHLDELVGGILQFEPPGDPGTELAEEMVFYQPTPARHVFELISRTALGRRDVLVDLGSGLGHVPLLAAICTDARSVGIEIEPTYVDSARRCAQALHLANADFVRDDARNADFSVGSVFYLYTPFTGTVMRSVLDALRREAGRRTFRVCSFGPCTAVLAAERWLASDDVPTADRIAIFRTRR